MKEALKWVFKITLIVLAFYLVFKKVTLDEIRAAWAELHAIWLVPAFILYNISQFISTFRLLQLLHAVGVQINTLPILLFIIKLCSMAFFFQVEQVEMRIK